MVMHISTVSILKMVKDKKNSIISARLEVMYWLSIFIYTIDLEGKVIQTQNANILEIVKYKAKITVIIKYESTNGLLLAYLHLTFIMSKGQGQGHTHFDDEYL